MVTTQQLIKALEDCIKHENWGWYEHCPLCILFRKNPDLTFSYDCVQCYKQTKLFPECVPIACFNFTPNKSKQQFRNNSLNKSKNWRKLANATLRKRIKELKLELSKS